MNRFGASPRQRQAGATSIEHVGLGVGLMALMIATAPAMGGPAATRVSSQVGSAIRELVASPTNTRTWKRVGTGGSGTPLQFTRSGERTSSRIVGDPGALSASELHPHPLVPTASWWTGHVTGISTLGPVRSAGRLTTCVLCGGAEARWDLPIGGGVQRAGGRVSGSDGLVLGGSGRAWGGLAGTTLELSSAVGSATRGARVDTHATATVGADAEVRAEAELGKLRQELRAEAGAVAGVSARAEQRASFRLAGIALRLTGGAEGWLGAGARAGVHVGHEGGGRFSFDTTWGAGVGAGGAFRLGGTVDLSHLLRPVHAAPRRRSRHRSRS